MGVLGGVGAVGVLIRVANGIAIEITSDIVVGIAGRISGVGGIVTIAVGCPDRPLRV